MLKKLTANIPGQSIRQRNISSDLIAKQLGKATDSTRPSKELQQTVKDLRVILPSALNHFKGTGYDEKNDVVFHVQNKYLNDITLEKDYKGKTYYVSLYFNNTAEGIAIYKQLSRALNGGDEMIKCVYEPFFGRSKIAVEIDKPIEINGSLHVRAKDKLANNKLSKTINPLKLLPD
ncbi:MAG: hypothetical protein CMP39_00320 [Rickettsiales bacterium]|nr:hypothetical protein [Rickettsiales bacterium]|tara:strand:- start:368 stop:895 length:528 start_codon:yes stop_codon:yes gene_type:complete